MLNVNLGRAKGKGLVKIELENKDTVSAVLRHKNMLNESEVCEICEIYLHKSKKEEVLMMEHNVDLILCEVGVHDDFVRLPSGYLKKKSENNFHGIP